MKAPPEATLDLHGESYKVRFDYDPGESQWFDARAGVGSPGHDPSVEITEVHTGAEWEDPSTLPDGYIEALEESLMTYLCEQQQESDQCRADALYNAMQDDAFEL
jgi:hypothetical protein